MDSLREHLLKLLSGKDAHVDFEEAVADFPAEARGKRGPSVPYSAWQLVEHLRIAQWDILEFSRDPGHVSPPWPGGYWPKTEAPPDGEAWDNSIRQFRKDLDAMRELISDSSADLFAPIPHGQGQALLREVLVLADHNAYHVGQLVFLRKLMGAWHD